MLLFLTATMAAVTSRANQQYSAASIAIFCVCSLQIKSLKDSLFRSVVNLSLGTSTNILALT